jgi:hypothetical protein
MEMTAEIKRYIKEKTAVLADFNLTDEYSVETHLKSKVDPKLSDEFNITRIDTIARQMIEDYWNGDTTFYKFSINIDEDEDGDD